MSQEFIVAPVQNFEKLILFRFSRIKKEILYSEKRVISGNEFSTPRCRDWEILNVAILIIC